MRRLATILLVFLILSSNSFAYYYLFESMQQDPVSRALGQTEILTTNGGNAVFSNPAHLMDVSQLIVNIGGYGVNGQLPDREIHLQETLYTYSNGLRFSHLSVAFPAWNGRKGTRCVIGGGYQKYFDWNQQYPRGKVYSEGANLLGVGAALVLKAKTAFGVSIVTPVPGDEIETHLLLYNQSMKHKYSMTMINLGLQMDVSDRFSLGILVRPAHERTYEKFAQYYRVTEDGDYVESYEDLTTTLPSVMGLAFRGDMSSKVSLFGEIQTRNWGELSTQVREFTYENNLDHGGALRFGIEWRGPITVRGGFYSTSIYLEDEEHPEETKARSGFTCGAGFTYRQVGLDFYVNKEWISTKGYDDTEVYEDPWLEPMEHVYRSSAVTLGLGITYRKSE